MRVGNSGALQRLIRGGSRTPLGRALVAIFWNVGGRSNIFCWFGRVSIVANYAGRPSMARGFDREIPAGFGWMGSAGAFILIFASLDNSPPVALGADFRGFEVESGAWADCPPPCTLIQMNLRPREAEKKSVVRFLRA